MAKAKKSRAKTKSKSKSPSKPKTAPKVKAKPKARSASKPKSKAKAKPSAGGRDQYWMLECWRFDVPDFMRVRDRESIPGAENWQSGKAFKTKIAEPIVMEWNPHASGPKKAYYASGITLMQSDVVAALREAGANNLDTYRTEIVDKKARKSDVSYLAVNVVGLANADLKRSEYEDINGDGEALDFESLAVDAKSVKGLKIFRIAECTTALVVHESVKVYFEGKGGLGLNFVHPEEWIG